MIGIYLRVSTETQVQFGLSLELQEEKGIRFAQSIGEEYEIFKDAGVSGGTLLRDGFQSMLKRIESGEISKVWVISKDRLTRASLSEALELRNFFIKNKVELFIDGQVLAFKSPEDLLQSNILDSIAEYQRLLIRKKSMEGRHKQIDKGDQRYCLIYGYDYQYLPNGTREWFINEDEAEMIRYIYDLYFQDLGFDDICRVLVRDGYKTKRWGTWDRGTIHKILRRPEYVGLTKNTKGELIPSLNYMPIMDKETWDKVQKTIDGKIRQRQGKYFRKADHELSGLITCSTCGAKHFFHVCPTRTGKRKETYAHKKLKQTEVDCRQSPLYFNAPISEYLMRVLFIRTFNDRKQVRQFMLKLEESLSKDTDKIRSDIKRVENNISKIMAEKKRLIDSIRKGIITDDDIQSDMEDIRKQLIQYENSKVHLRNELAVKSADVQTVIDSFADDIVRKFLYAEPLKKREMYIKYCKSIQTEGYKLKVEFLTGQKEAYHIRQLPEWLMDEMILLKFIDQHPEYEQSKDMLVQDVSFNRFHINTEDEELNDGVHHSFMVSMPDQSFYDLLNEERAELRSSFILKTKGRPRRFPPKSDRVPRKMIKMH